MKEAVFSTLGPDIEGARVLDLFSGSGGLGLEALSRGASHARLVERDPAALAVIERNIADLGESDRAEVLRGDALLSSSWGEEPWDVVFFDPPYRLLEQPETRSGIMETMQALSASSVGEAGVLVVHVRRGILAQAHFPARLDVVGRDYGSGSVWYVRGPADASQGGD